MGLKVKGYKYLFRSTEPFDLVIKHALILDGSGENERFRGDIAIRDGFIAAVGYVNPRNSPVYDAGGLTVLPAPIPLEKTEDMVEHLFSTAFPRYAPEEIFFTDGEYRGHSLEEVAAILDLPPGQAFQTLLKEQASEMKILLVPFDYQESSEPRLADLLAKLTGYRATVMGKSRCGMIKAGFEANLWFIRTADYSETQLAESFKKGIFPNPLVKMEKGRFIVP